MILARARMTLMMLRRSGSRAVLAVAAVALSIASMMLVLTLSGGAELQLRTINEELGRNLFGVSPVEVSAIAGRPQGWFVSPRLKIEDAIVLRDDVRALTTVAPVREGSFRTSFAGAAITTSVVGVTPDYLTLRNLSVASGRPLDEQDGARRSRVALAGSYVARKLNGGFSMVGETIWIGRVPFEIVGQLREKGASSEGLNEDDQILIPLETAMRRLFNTDSLSRLLIQVESEEQLDPAQVMTREVLRATHELDRDTKDDFKILSLVRANEIRRRSSAFLRGLATIFAAVTLVVGGAGVLAVTALNVKDRVPEIGLRMAVGARPRDITAMFISEACVLSVAGGLAGLVIGSAGLTLIDRFLGWALAADVRSVVVPFLVSVLLGVVFSVVPAVRAASVMPVNALRDR